MRFKKGSKVEVTNKEVPASWHVAEIVSGNEDAYNVRYSSESWVTGDIVEVFDENSWKIATVVKVLKGGRYMVRPHESTLEIRAHKTNIRARRSWCNGQWIPVGKISRTEEGKPNYSMKICQKEGDCLLACNDARLKKLNRASPFCSSHLKAKKLKPAEKDGSQSQRHSFKKSDNWRHASLASKGSIQDSGSAAFLLEKAVGHFSISICYR